MAYLEQMKYTGKLLCCLIDEEEVGAKIELSEMYLKGSLERYKTLIVKQEIPSENFLPEAYKAMQLYVNYRRPQGEIKTYILNNKHKNKKTLVGELLTLFPHYGLGDLQYEALIEEC